MSQDQKLIDEVRLKLEPQMSSLQEAVASRMRSFQGKCLALGSPDKYAECIVQDQKRMERERELFEARMLFMTKTLSKCVADAGEPALCKKNAVNTGSEEISGFFKRLFEGE